MEEMLEESPATCPSSMEMSIFTPAPERDVQMASCGALPNLTMVAMNGNGASVVTMVNKV